jgi:hypothetical protein
MMTYGETLAALYRAIQSESDATYVVDATKDPQHAYILASLPGFDVRVVHLVRDSRGVVFSWRRSRRRPEIHWEPRDMPRYSGVRTVIAWSLTNLAAEAARRRMPYLLMRYEELAREPGEQLARILKWLGHEPVDLGFIRPGSALLAPAHSVAGNPMRFQTGLVEIQADEEWKTRMGRFQRAVVTELTRGLLARYGYSSGLKGTEGFPSTIGGKPAIPR